jgi:citrate lyase subunit beta/citryl-CoA lyase
MTGRPGPEQALFAGEKRFPALPVCDHYAGHERFIRKALAVQRELGPLFDVTCDCEDGAPAGRETEHAEMAAALIASADNAHGRCGVRIHDPTHPHWRRDIDLVLAGAGDRLAYITIPKVTSAPQTALVIDYVRETERRLGLGRRVPVHVLIETHGALREAFAIAALPSVEALSFGLLDFVSAHHGAIPAAAMKSPGQFQHALVCRAKAEIAAAALANGCVPAHNVSMDLDDSDRVRDDARRARLDYGYLRMWSIHPGQILPIVEAMRPEAAEVDRAAAILAAAQAADWGPVRHAGELHDRASYRYYWSVLQRAAATGAELPASAAAWFRDG